MFLGIFISIIPGVPPCHSSIKGLGEHASRMMRLIARLNVSRHARLKGPQEAPKWAPLGPAGGGAAALRGNGRRWMAGPQYSRLF